MSTRFYFAYGSLVNPRARLTNIEAVRAYLRGWVRQWRHCVQTPTGKVCALTAAQNPNKGILGVVIPEAADIAEMDAREIGYRRIEVPVFVSSPNQSYEQRQCLMYVSSLETYRPGSEEFPIWRSYLDCVLAGYWELGGIQSVQEFLDTTEGWEVPILDDRKSPLYPRAIKMDEAQQVAIDQILNKKGLLRLLVTSRDWSQ